MKNNSGDDVRGEHEVRRNASGGSNPSPLTKSVKTKLWNRLRKLDREIERLHKKYNSILVRYKFPKDWQEIRLKINKLDLKRKETRLKLKGYK